MPGPSTSAGVPKLTDSELRFVSALFESMSTLPEADWDNCADVLGLKDSKCAKERWRQISVRHGWSRHSKKTTTTSSSGPVPASRNFGMNTRPSRPTANDSTSASDTVSGSDSRPGSSRTAAVDLDPVGVVPRRQNGLKDTATKSNPNQEPDVKTRHSTKSRSGINTETEVEVEESSQAERPTKSERGLKTKAGFKNLRRVKKQKLDSGDEVIEVKKEHEGEKRPKVEKADEGDHDDAGYPSAGQLSSGVPYGHPEHCMSF